jgi:beta-phosphoglucomutase-like phosphatase (HAD superfamily)
VPDLVIFDCDGVLVDSELIFARVLAECLVAVDLPATTEEALVLGFGKNRATLCAAVESRFGRPLSDEFFETMRARTALVLERELQPIPGVEELLNTLPLPRCVASNGHLQRVRERLAVTGLLRFFDPHVFSAIQVTAGKPAPISSCSRPSGSACGPATASWSRTASPASRRRLRHKCRSSGFAAAATARMVTPID